MFTPFELTIRNFMSFGNNETKIRLDFNSPTLIVGKNHDSAVDGQLDSNGSGKTTILNAITYALYGGIISDKAITADELINNINKKNLYVSLVFSTGNNTFYKIERYRKNKDHGGNGVRVFERYGGSWEDAFEADHDITPDSIANADEKISTVIGMAFEVFSRIVAFSATHKPFLFLPASEQTEIIEEICGLSELSEKAELLKKQSKADKQELERLTEINNTIKIQRNQILNQILSAKGKAEQWEIDRDADMQARTEELRKLIDAGIDYDEQIELLEFVQNVDAKIAEYEANKREYISERRSIESDIHRHDAWITKQIEAIHNANIVLESMKKIDSETIIGNLRNLATMKGNLQELRDRLTACEAERSAISKTVREKEEELTHLRGSTCPYCSQQFKDSKAKVVEIESQLGVLTKTANNVQVEIDSIELNIPSLVGTIEALESTLEFKSESEVVAYQSKYETALARATQLTEEENPYPLNKKQLLAEINDIDADIKKLDRMIMKKEAKKVEAKEALRFDKLQQITAEKSRIETIESQIEQLKKAKNPLTSTVKELEGIQLEDTKDAEIEELESLIDHQQFLIKLLTKKDSFVRKLLLQKSLPFLNTRLRYYLDRIGFLHKVAFQEDLSVKISQFGNGIGFGNLSSGQKARINLALSFSFRDMLQARHGKLKFCILDECLDVGLGNVGVQLAVKMIKAVATEENISMFVISHRDEIQNMFDKRLVVELRNGFSNLEETA